MQTRASAEDGRIALPESNSVIGTITGDYSSPVRDAIQPVKVQLSPQEIERKRELREYLGGAYRRLDLQLKREGRRPWHLSESEVYAFKLRDDALTAEMLSMRRLYEEKSGRSHEAQLPVRTVVEEGRRVKEREQRRQGIETAKTPAGGWTRDQLAKWGVPWPPPKGWKKRLLDEGREEERLETLQERFRNVTVTADEA